MRKHVSPATLPALGDIRQCGEGDTLYIDPAMRGDKQWPRYTDAIRDALSKGAGITWLPRKDTP